MLTFISGADLYMDSIRGQASIEFMIIISVLIMIFSIVLFTGNELRTTTHHFEGTQNADYLAHHLGSIINATYYEGSGAYNYIVLVNNNDAYTFSVYNNKLYVSDDNMIRSIYTLAIDNIQLNAVRYNRIKISNSDGNVVVEDAE